MARPSRQPPSRRFTSRVVAVFAAVAITATACAESAITLSADGGSASTTTPGETVPTDPTDPTDPTVPTTPPTTEPASVLPDGADSIAAEAIRAAEAFWARSFVATYGGSFVPLEGGVFPYGPDSDIPDCGERLTYDDVANNAFYCPIDDYIVWDAVALLPDLAERFGGFTIAIVMAHEYGHAIQERVLADGATVTLELQADCFAGAWTADVRRGGSPGFRISGADLDKAVAGFLELRDGIGVDRTDPNAHGSGFDRISAFQDGFDNGVDRCATYEENPPIVVARCFLSPDDFERGGNLPINQLLPLLLVDLESFFDAIATESGLRWDPVDDVVFTTPREPGRNCGFGNAPSYYCPDDDTIYIDAADFVPALDEIGDFAVGGEVARQYAFAAQLRFGLDLGRAAGNHADCLTGVFAAAEFGGIVPDQQLALSPGDVDEVIIAFLTDPGGTGNADEGGVFDRTRVFRLGFFDGIGGCDTLF